MTRKWLVSLIACLALIAAILLGVAIGETSIKLTVVVQAIVNKLGSAGYILDPIDEGIIWNYRLPRALVAGACGAGLATCGVILQSLLRNPLADPYLLGISAGASTGAVLVALFGLGAGVLTLSGGAFVGAITAFALVTLLARAGGASAPATQIILAGIAGSQLFNALTAFLITKSANSEQARGIMFWMLGSLSGVRWSSVWLAVPISLLGLIVCLWHRRALDAFTFGVDSAAGLGIPVRRIQLLLISSAALVTAIMVSIVGSIGFVGLVIPHAVRLLSGTRHAHLLPLSALSGALFLIAADILSRTLIVGQVIPVGVITALVGAPVFALILLDRRRMR
ncbi:MULTISPECIES: iron chelate uptake ABC transporter family permease subunit [unclassified Brenneria]|uniref:FecCD family ABC transporter permease n=1 Tax=unclassified Brenneria TaxID=2634434 RepID=UPI001553CD9C|nr:MULTISPECIES: iron chelate uptake ABC transporter family permease subunit [unclassified Brenneria]MEE3644456.1 iron chelate uptake ABC transporter family permease subunit [Brenneria sp. L3_3C_1]MEE3652018.1 iron chelate uptake ABC transporter family permease subunit [Brenneria sp. HEZEL_4_2_4]MEE3663636.1 iron chelate uptake ABC transporter family permease subunit [Brenneria sp. g21c3]MBJ7223214.1 iron chelate uptake ABC transporter family permease subunit [Brenneria sp. L3-3C-1]MDX5628574.